jgi:hypothetical protein
MPDGVNVLVTRDEPAPNGVTRPDLFLWNSRSGALQRVTRGAGIRQADPSPDGRSGRSMSRRHGSIVVIAMQSGAWRLLVAGSPELVAPASPQRRWFADRRQLPGRADSGRGVIDAASGSVHRMATW